MDNKYKFAVVLPSKTQDPNGFYKRGIVDILKKQISPPSSGRP